MDFIDYVDFASFFHRSELDPFPKIADFVYSTIRCSINFNDVHGVAVLNSDTCFTSAARIGSRAFLAVQRFCKHLGYSSFACSSRTTEKVCMGCTACSYGITKRARDMILPHDFGECLRSKSAIQRDICHIWFPLTQTHGLPAPFSNLCSRYCHGRHEKKNRPP